MTVDPPKTVAAAGANLTLAVRQNKHHPEDRHGQCRQEPTVTPSYLQQHHDHKRHNDPRRPPLNIAILLNSYRSRFLNQIRASYVRTIGAVDPDARLTFFEPANRQGDFPADPSSYDLIVLGGANVDPRASYPWILEIHDFIRQLVRLQQHQAAQPRSRQLQRRRVPKLLGICWGHQTIARVFGGEVIDSPSPEMGVGTISLTSEGQDFFFPPNPSLQNHRHRHHQSCGKTSARPTTFDLQQHHRREVARPAAEFTALAAGNQVLAQRHRRYYHHHHQCGPSGGAGNKKMNNNNKKMRSSVASSPDILTFQGHPEKDAETARLRLHDAVRWFGLREETKKVKKKKEQKKCAHGGNVGGPTTGEHGGEKKEEEEEQEEEDEAAAKQRTEAWNRLRNMMELPHDGEMVWRRLLEWVREDDDEEYDNDDDDDGQTGAELDEHCDGAHSSSSPLTMPANTGITIVAPRSLKI